MTGPQIVPKKKYYPQLLGDYVDVFEVYEIDDHLTHPMHVLPLGVVQVFFQFDGQVRHSTSFTEGWETRPEVFVAGPYDRSYLLTAQKGMSMFSIRFHPGKYRYFFDQPINFLRNSLVPLSNIWGKKGGDLAEQMVHAGSHEARCIICEQFLLSNLKHLYRSPIELAVHIILKQRGMVKVEDLCYTANLSIAQFRKRFTAEMGLSPKEYRKLVRIDALRKYQNRHPHLSLTNLAHRFGYHDQSHFIRDFRSIAGLSPKKYFA